MPFGAGRQSLRVVFYIELHLVTTLTFFSRDYSISLTDIEVKLRDLLIIRLQALTD